MNQTYQLIKYPSEAYEGQEIPMPASMIEGKIGKLVYDKKYGALVYFDGLRYPIKGLTDPIALRNADIVKKYLKSWLKLLSNKLVVLALIPLFLLPPKRFNGLVNQWLTMLGEFSDYILRHHYLKEEWYSPATREIRRAGLKVFSQGQTQGYYDTGGRIICSLAVILEVDRAYRYRLQDVLQLLNQENISPKEIKRLIYILADRDNAREWKKIGWALWLLLTLRPSLMRPIRELLREISLESLWFGEDDLYFLLPAEGYNYLGLDKERRLRLYKKLLERTKNGDSNDSKISEFQYNEDSFSI